MRVGSQKSEVRSKTNIDLAISFAVGFSQRVEGIKINEFSSVGAKYE
ncbi:hypothetical protein AQPE_3039 [Aquipluma nitroreducens]|uniref:Uncharacterized protein n=1 Tax=Aquipluma nitroreducens TaxID=2010828 RepID=A0A5K7SBL3_9BACT|nr:hypothetical protein AQPE_3039 [Aquipluma nitroreducens]